MAVGTFPGAGRPADRGTGAAEEARRAEWLALAARAVRADSAARARVGRDARLVRVRTVPQAVARTVPQAVARTAERAVERPVAAVLDPPRHGPVVRTLLLVLCGVYGFVMAAVTAVAVARYAMTEPLGAVGPVAFIGVAVGFLALGATVAVSAVRSRSARRD